jgi:hypothetical protein
MVKLGFLDGVRGFQYAFYKAWYFLTMRLMIQETMKPGKVSRNRILISNQPRA